MSEISSTIRSRSPDRRARRSRAALLAAFNGLVLKRGYDEISVGDVSQAADVGRSTFYQHFSSKADLLAHSMTGLLQVMADGCVGEAPPPGLGFVLAHFWDNRQLARIILRDETKPAVVRRLTDLIEQRLEPIHAGRDAPPTMPLRLAATQLAGGQVGLLEEWLQARHHCAPEALAQAMSAGCRASAAALLAPPTASA